METVSGVSNWKLVIRREERSVRILRGVTCDERAVLPEELFGLPVTELGGHALSPTAPAGAEGEEVLVSCGLTDEEAQWDNRRLTDLTLPAVLQKVGDYALLNCSGLKTLRLHDGVTFWGGGALMNCRSLDTFFLTRVGEQQESLSFFADELSRELDVTIYETDGQTVHLIFPEFVEAYEENCPAHHFDYNIYGAGYPYHHCFRQKKLSLREYDTLWKGFLGMEHDEESGVRLAWWRLRCPGGADGAGRPAVLGPPGASRRHTAAVAGVPAGRGGHRLFPGAGDPGGGGAGPGLRGRPGGARVGVSRGPFGAAPPEGIRRGGKAV